MAELSIVSLKRDKAHFSEHPRWPGVRDIDPIIRESTTVSDDDKDALLWTARPPVRQRRPGEMLWTIPVNNVTWSAELRFHGEGYGWDCAFFRETEFFASRRFLLREEALAWAELLKKDLEKGDI